MSRLLWLAGLLFFLYAAAMQYNDPDPLVWMSLYGIVALANLGAMLGKLSRRWIALAAFPHILFGIWLSPHLLRTTADAFATVGMKNDQDELVREAWGAVICVLWMAALYVYARHPTSPRVEAHA
jgi:hypothetical protein